MRAGDREPPEHRRGRVVGMTLQFGTQAKKSVAGKSSARKGIEPQKRAKSHGDTAAKSPCLGNAAKDFPCKGEG